MMPDKGLIGLASATAEDLLLNQRAIEAGNNRKLDKLHVVTWFLPPVTHALKGGVRTVFMFSERLSEKFGALNIFVIYSHGGNDFDVSGLSNSLIQHFPKLRFLIKVYREGKQTISEIPKADIAFCTLWTTAYLLLKYNQVSRKFYFMQDYEPLFYEAGSVYAVIEQTYRFGFSCIANTHGVGNRYQQYSNDVVSFLPGVDSQIFNPVGRSGSTGHPYRIVFYGRPGNPRNCFSLGVMILKAVKRKMKNRVEIISVGAEWDVSGFGLNGIVENRGLLSSLEDVADLYRQSDIGLVFMVTPHPSYQPLEYMACGCVVATNINESNRWLLTEKNSLQLEPIPEIAAEKIVALLVNKERMNEIRKAGLEAISLLGWDSAYETFEKRVLLNK